MIYLSLAYLPSAAAQGVYRKVYLQWERISKSQTSGKIRYLRRPRRWRQEKPLYYTGL